MIGIVDSLMNATKNWENVPLPLYHDCYCFSSVEGKRNRNSYSNFRPRQSGNHDAVQKSRGKRIRNMNLRKEKKPGRVYR